MILQLDRVPDNAPVADWQAVNSEDEREAGLSFRYYFGIIRKKLWLILAIVGIVALPTYIKYSKMEPVYRATVKLLIERYNPQVIKVDEVMLEDAYTKDYYPTQYEILKSASIAEKVIQAQDLDRHPEFNSEPEPGLLPIDVRSAFGSVVSSLLPSGDAEKKSPATENLHHLTPYINAYLSRLYVEPVKESRMVHLSFEGHDPALITRVVNAHARAYINKNMEMKISASEEAVDWLGGRLQELKSKLRESEEALYRFQEKEDIVLLESILSAGNSREENILIQKLTGLNADLNQARSERVNLETRHHQIEEFTGQPQMAESLAGIMDSSKVQQLQQELLGLERRYAMWRRDKYGEKHPHMQALQDEINILRFQLGEEIEKAARGLEIQYRMAKAKEQNIQNVMDNAKKEVMELNRKAIRYGMLKREVATNREMFDMILKRAKETSLTSALKSTNIFIVDAAKPPRAPIRPRVGKRVSMAALFALALGIGLAVFWERLDNTFHGPSEVTRYLGLPFLGPVGIADRKHNASDLIMRSDPRSNFSETLRTIRTNVMFSLSQYSQKTFLVTSPGPEEGKTFITANLGASLAHMGRKVLLVDADLRKPRLHHVFKTEPGPGLSELVLEETRIYDAVVDTEIENLQLLPSGTIPPNPSELLGSRRMASLLAEMQQSYDYVLFDSPPFLLVTDAAVLTSFLDGVVLVVKASETTRGNAQRCLEQLQDVRAHIMGVVVNHVDFRKERYYYNYDSSYYYYYAEDGRKRKRMRRGKPFGGFARGLRNRELI